MIQQTLFGPIKKKIRLTKSERKERLNKIIEEDNKRTWTREDLEGM